jgi:hypothetical protein
MKADRELNPFLVIKLLRRRRRSRSVNPVALEAASLVLCGFLHGRRRRWRRPFWLSSSSTVCVLSRARNDERGKLKGKQMVALMAWGTSAEYTSSFVVVMKHNCWIIMTRRRERGRDGGCGEQEREEINCGRVLRFEFSRFMFWIFLLDFFCRRRDGLRVKKGGGRRAEVWRGVDETILRFFGVLSG